ncbi:MAG TPA: aminoglycoside phosphotransferase family protein [Ardenticatenaceae bacterium]|jgi:Ser/Thr protein kinase RdoA (MazF antagonist)
MQRPTFDSRDAYAATFTNPDYWLPYVNEVCTRHELACSGLVRAGLPGTNPVFLVGEQYAVKLITDLFDGAASFPAELEVYQLFARTEDFPAPALLAHGNLFEEREEWHWPYIVTSLVPGTSLGEVEAQVAYEDKIALAQWLDAAVRRLHDLPVTEMPHLSRSRNDFRHFISRQMEHCAANQRRWAAMPEHLIDQIEGYLPPVEQLVGPSSGWSLLHCDLNVDHVLGEFEDGCWVPRGIIDFGDARRGEWLHELGALHLGLFRFDKHLLGHFLQSYGFDVALREDFARRAMSFTLLHEFSLLESFFRHSPHAASAQSLDEVAALLWAVEL